MFSSSIQPRLWVHAVTYGLLLAVITGVIPLDASFGVDDGAYGGQVYALEQGGWALDRPVAVVDEDNEGWLNTAITPEGPTPYTANPAYALLLAGASGAADTVADWLRSDQPDNGPNRLGMQLLPVLGALAAACVAWVLASRWSPGAAPLAFWLLALGPVLVNSTTLWAHTLSTALGGGAVLAVVRLVEWGDGPKRRATFALGVVGLVTALALSAVIRTEAVFWVVAVTATLVLIGRSFATVVAAVLGAGIGGGAWLANRSWGHALRADRLPIETSVEVLNGSSGWLESRFSATWQLLLTSPGEGGGAVLTLAAVCLLGFVSIKHRRTAADPAATASAETAAAETDAPTQDGGGPDPFAIFVIGAVILYGLRLVVAPGQLIAGTIAAWPAAVVLLLATSRSDDRDDRLSIWLLLAPCGVLLVLVALTQYASSGGLQWGGRYLSMGFVPLAVAAAVRGERLFGRYRRPLTALLVIPAIVGIAASHSLHTTHHSVVATVTAEPSEVVITEAAALPRIAWTALPIAFYRADDDNVEALLSQLAASGVATVNVHGLTDVALDGASGYRLVTENGPVRHLALSLTPSPGALDEGP